VALERLILGSASPRRREILTRVGIAHQVVVGGADEAVLPGEAPHAYLERVVGYKLAAVLKALPVDLASVGVVVLVADTTVVLGADILGKPVDEADGASMIARLSGKTHEVCTRFALAAREGQKGQKEHGPYGLAYAETVTTKVTFRELDAAERAAYVKHGEGTDKAGGYAIQGTASGFVTRIEGSYTNVVGLPAAEVIVALRRLGFAA
jgi:septum formation protein